MSEAISFEEFSKQCDVAKLKVIVHPEFASFRAHSYKDFMARDGVAWSASISYKGRIVAHAGNDGNGGPCWLDWDHKIDTTVAEKVFDQLVKVANQKYEGYAMVLECILTGSGM